MKSERRATRRAERDAFLARIAEGEARGCLVCRETDGGFASEEHVIGESIGNTELVLPNGVVCDRCNHGPLAALDEELGEFFPIKMRRTQLGITTKAGKILVTRFEGGEFRMGEPAELFFAHNSEQAFRILSRDGPVTKFQINAKGGKRITPSYCSILSRALLKAGLECAWIDLGERMLEPQYDHVREAILGTARHGYLSLVRAGDPDHVGIELTHWPLTREDDGRDFLLVITKIYGITLATDSLRPELPIQPPDEMALTVTFP